MGVFDVFTDFLKGSVGNNLANDPQDIKNTKRNLERAGFFKDDTENDFLTKTLDAGIRTYQRNKNLKEDGTLFPGGETERSLFETLTGLSAHHVFGAAQNENTGHVGFGGNISGMLERKTPETGKRLVREKENRKTPESDFANTSSNDKPVDYDATGRMIRQKINTESQFKIPSAAEKPPENTAASKEKIDRKLLDFIGRLESSDNYNVIAGGQEKPLTKMTVKEIRKLQKDLEDKGANSTAVGRYQVKDTTLDYLIKRMGLDENTIFDEKLQDSMAVELFKRRGFESLKSGNISVEEFIYNLSQEWAALPKDTSNKSYHGKIGNNKALTDFKTLKDLLEKK